MLRPNAKTRRLRDDLICELVIIDSESGETEILYDSTALIEAPNWSPCGKWIVYNADGRLWRMAVDGSEGPLRIDTGDVQDWNNDHVISVDGSTIYGSVNDGHIYAVPFEGGSPRRVTEDRGWNYYLHGVGADDTLAYVALEFSPLVTRVHLLGEEDIQLTDGAYPVDGPEFSPDGKHIWYNGEAPERVAGHAQVYRMDRDGGNVVQMTGGERVNWFPHVSPDGTKVSYISYPAGTLGHPADKDVQIRLMDIDGTNDRLLDSFNGGQGTINVNSWAPDSRRFAYVRYPSAVGNTP